MSHDFSSFRTDELRCPDDAGPGHAGISSVPDLRWPGWRAVLLRFYRDSGCCLHWYIILLIIVSGQRFRENGGIGGALRGRGLIAVAGMVLACSVAACAKDIALISNKENHASEVTVAELVKICKGQMTRWPDGKPASIVMRDPALPEVRMGNEKGYGERERGV